MEERMIHLNKKKKGFTLLELMIVVIIIGILASLAMPRFIDAAKKAKEAEAMSILGSVRASQLRYFIENNAYTAIVGDLDLSLTSNPTDYFTYTALDGSVGSNIGQAAAIAGTGLDNYRIAVDGTIASY